MFGLAVLDVFGLAFLFRRIFGFASAWHAYSLVGKKPCIYFAKPNAIKMVAPANLVYIKWNFSPPSGPLMAGGVLGAQLLSAVDAVFILALTAGSVFVLTAAARRCHLIHDGAAVRAILDWSVGAGMIHVRTAVL